MKIYRLYYLKNGATTEWLTEHEISTMLNLAKIQPNYLGLQTGDNVIMQYVDLEEMRVKNDLEPWYQDGNTITI